MQQCRYMFGCVRLLSPKPYFAHPRHHQPRSVQNITRLVKTTGLPNSSQDVFHRATFGTAMENGHGGDLCALRSLLRARWKSDSEPNRTSGPNGSDSSGRNEEGVIDLTSPPSSPHRGGANHEPEPKRVRTGTQ